VPHDHHRVLTRVFFQHLLKIGKSGLRPERILHHQFAFVPHFVPYQRRRLQGAFQRAGNDDVRLYVERSQGAADIATLLDAIFIEAALFIFLRGN